MTRAVRQLARECNTTERDDFKKKDVVSSVMLEKLQRAFIDSDITKISLGCGSVSQTGWTDRRVKAMERGSQLHVTLRKSGFKEGGRKRQ